MTSVNCPTTAIAMLSPLGPDLTNATAAEVAEAIAKAFRCRPLVAENQATINPQACRPSEISAWLIAHGAKRWRFRFDPPLQFELVKELPSVGPAPRGELFRDLPDEDEFTRK